MKLIAMIAVLAGWLLLAATSAYPDEKYILLETPECVVRDAC